MLAAFDIWLSRFFVTGDIIFGEFNVRQDVVDFVFAISSFG